MKRYLFMSVAILMIIVGCARVLPKDDNNKETSLIEAPSTRSTDLFDSRQAVDTTLYVKGLKIKGRRWEEELVPHLVTLSIKPADDGQTAYTVHYEGYREPQHYSSINVFDITFTGRTIWDDGKLSLVSGPADAVISWMPAKESDEIKGGQISLKVSMEGSIDEETQVFNGVVISGTILGDEWSLVLPDFTDESDKAGFDAMIPYIGDRVEFITVSIVNASGHGVRSVASMKEHNAVAWDVNIEAGNTDTFNVDTDDFMLCNDFLRLVFDDGNTLVCARKGWGYEYEDIVPEVSKYNYLDAFMGEIFVSSPVSLTYKITEELYSQAIL